MKDFLKRQLKAFLISHFVISIVVGGVGMFLSPDKQYGYWVLFIPILYAALCVLPGFVMYSKKELSIKQVVIRMLIQLTLVEGIMLILFTLFGSLETAKEVVVIVISVVVVYVTVQFIEWRSEVKDTRQMNKVLSEVKRNV